MRTPFSTIPLAAIPAVVALAASGCSSEPALDGTWAGRATVDGVTFSFTLEIRESECAITGNATFTADGVSFSGSVEGSYTGSNIEMTFALGETFTLRWEGTRTDDDTLTGAITIPSIGRFDLTFRRES